MGQIEVENFLEKNKLKSNTYFSIKHIAKELNLSIVSVQRSMNRLIVLKKVNYVEYYSSGFFGNTRLFRIRDNK